MEPVPDVRTGLDAPTLARAVREHLFYETGRQPETATLNDVYLAVAATVRDRLFHRVTATLDRQAAGLSTRAVAYLSAEFLMGPQLGANLLNLDIVLPMRQALAELGLDGAEAPGLVEGGDPAVHPSGRQWTILLSGSSMMSLAPASLRAGITGLIIFFSTTDSTA